MSKVVRTPRKTPVLFVAAAALSTLGLVAVVPTEADAYPAKVERACKADYKTHCPTYKEGSTALRNCMSLAGRRGNLSRGCVNALTDAGLVPRKYRKN